MLEDENFDDSDFEEEIYIEKHQPRPYQLQVLEIARNKNTIAFLDTGTGKTFIAMMLIKETPGKSVFIAPVKALVYQQASVAKNFEISSIGLVGEKAES